MDDDKTRELRMVMTGSLGAYEQYLPAREYGIDPLIEIVERNLLGGFDRETPAVIDEIAEQFADVLELAQWAGFVDEGASLESLADAFDAYTRDPANGADDWPSPTESANGMLSLVAGLIRRARGSLEPKRTKLGDGREISIGIGFQNSAASAALYLVIARSEISGAISARQNSVKAAADANRKAGAPTREKVLKIQDEIKAMNPSAKKERIAWEAAERLGMSFGHVRKLLREPKSKDRQIDVAPRHDADTPRCNDDAL